VLPVSGQERVLIDTERPHPTDPPRAVNQGPAMQDHRRPGGVPRHPVLVGHRRHRTAQSADLATHLHTGTQRQHLPGSDPGDALRPGLSHTTPLPAPQSPLDQHQPRRTPETVHAAQVNLDAVLRLRPAPARPTPRLGYVDSTLTTTSPTPSSTSSTRRPGNPSIFSCQPDTVTHRQGPPVRCRPRQP
jgi:hypothetical protein